MQGNHSGVRSAINTGMGALLLWAGGLPGTALAADAPLICFGNEPSWRVDLTTPGVAGFATPDGGTTDYRGGPTRHAFLAETLWRGTAPDGRDLVVWLQDKACSDGMSDTTHPVTARVSLPDGRFLSGCCRVAPAAAEARALEDGTWQLTELPGIPALANLARPITARFEAGRVAGFGGCNNFTGGYRLEGDRLTIDRVASTMMACPEPAATAENAFHRAFAGTFRYVVEGDQLTATADSGAVLRFVQAPLPKLAGVEWQVTSYNNNRQAVVGVTGDTPLTLSFADGQVTGNAGCNTFRGTYTTQGQSIAFGPLATTRRACAEPLMAQEREFLLALASAVTWRIDGKVLDMHRADGERAIWAVAP